MMFKQLYLTHGLTQRGTIIVDQKGPGSNGNKRDNIQFPELEH